MSSVVDTSILVDDLRGHEPARQTLRRARQQATLFASVVTRTELLVGMSPRQEERLAGLLAAIEWQPVSRRIADRAGELGREWLPSHSGIDLGDLLIAATALTLELPLLTRNVRHFPMFPDLAPPY